MHGTFPHDSYDPVPEPLLPIASPVIIGTSCLVTSVIQGWYWVSCFGFEHSDWIPRLLHWTFQRKGILPEIAVLAAWFYIIFFGYMVFELARVGYKLIRVSRRMLLPIDYISAYNWNVLKTAACLGVVLFTRLIFSLWQVPQEPQVDIVGVALLLMLMSCYSWFASLNSHDILRLGIITDRPL